MQQIFEYINSIHPLGDELTQHLIEIIRPLKLKRKDHLLHTGEVCKNLHFIEKGILRCYCLDTDKTDPDVTTWLMGEGELVIAVKSFYGQLQSDEIIQAMEDCILYYISYDQFDKASLKYLEFSYIRARLTEKYYSLFNEHRIQLLTKSAYQRVQWFDTNFPDIKQRISAAYIASYLGITQETLSRIHSGKKY